MCSGSEEGSYLMLIDFCITQLYGHRLESNKEEEEVLLSSEPRIHRFEAVSGVGSNGPALDFPLNM